MSEFRFADPEWAHALWAVAAVVVLLFWLEQRGASALDRLVGRSLQSRLVRRSPAWRRRLRIALLGLSALCLVLALMRPQWGLRYVATPRVGAELMIAIDVSRSMLAEDVAPSRLERAKAEIADLLTYLDDDQVGLIAFAGRASVVSPLTPDFSFLRLVLDGIGPGSVTRGGTRLGEPIRKAVAGFGPAGKASRAILLITDGEDHDSFPMDAAQQAAEAGIKIIAIGFGDEGGSEIVLADPDSGARTLLLDADGRPVRSRLDGELLRELALATGGAYVPAGTGVLDLESIYDQHIARLTRGRLDARGRAVRDEAYPWAVLLGLALLVSSCVVSTAPAARMAAFAAFALLAGTPPPAGAQTPEDPPVATPLEEEGTAAEPGAGAEPELLTPRDRYNLGVAALAAGTLEDSERQLRDARAQARGDGVMRYAASYDLGWAAVRRADALEAEAPPQALAALYEAADWFRDAVGQRPDQEDPRHNLEVALRRALLLEDRLPKKEETGLELQLAQLATRERALTGQIAALLQQTRGDPEIHASEALRREFRGHATVQRTLLADTDQVAEQVGRERDAIEARPEQERSPEDSMRAAQLTGVLHHLHRTQERMGQARRQLRQHQAARSYRRTASALGSLKRAQDQLRDPLALLDVVLADALEVQRATGLLAASRGTIPGLEVPVEAPVWLTLDSAAEDQADIAERAGELHARLRAGLDAPAAPPPDPEQQALFDSVREAEPFVAVGSEQLAKAAAALGAEDPVAALESQRAGLEALLEARERFFDLRRLIEATAADERRILGVLAAEGDDAKAAREEFLASLHAVQAKNLARAERLETKLAAEGEQQGAGLAAPPDPAAGQAPDPEAIAREQQRLELAGQLLTLSLAGMDDVQRAFGDPEDAKARPAWDDARSAALRAVGHLEELRRLFFTVVEQLRELAQRQVDLADRTQDAIALGAAPDADVRPQLAPLVPRQGELGERAGEIAAALVLQSEQAGGVVAEDAQGAGAGEQLRLAAEHVVGAQTEMEAAGEALAAEPPEPDAALGRQQVAVAELEEALALLAPPPQDPDDDSQQDDSGEDEQQAQQEPEAQPEPQAQQDPGQLLQEVRDREAQRRREQGERARASSETVEKNW